MTCRVVLLFCVAVAVQLVRSYLASFCRDGNELQDEFLLNVVHGQVRKLPTTNGCH